MKQATKQDKKRGSSVTTHALTKTFNGNMALQPTTLEIPAGEILVLLGPSGCGKTTLLRLIAGLEQPDGPGMIHFDGEDVSGVTIERRNIGMVFQSYALFPNMTVAENVAYGLKVRKVGRAERDAQTQRLLTMVGLEDFADRRIDKVSGGQRQRVALARALAIKPRVLLLDEPLAALDAVLRERLRIEIGELLRDFGITAVYVTHDQAEAMAIGDRIAVMQRGAIAQIDTPQMIYRRPANAFVAEFVGTMNRLDGKVTSGVLAVGEGDLATRLAIGGADRNTTLWFRPEAIRLSSSSEAPIRGQLRSSIFFGATQRLTVGIAPGKELQIDVSSDLSFKAGDALRLDIAPEALLEFQPET